MIVAAVIRNVDDVSGLALPLTIIFIVQVPLVALVAAVSRVMGRDYESIVMAGGHRLHQRP